MGDEAVAATPPMLRDAELERRLVSHGFAVVPLLGASVLDALAAAYAELAPAPDDDIVIDYTRRDRELVGRLDALLRDCWAAHLPYVLHDHQVALTTFVAKHPGEGSAMFLHDDRSYADPRRHRSVTLWIPFVDVGPGSDNGGLEVVPGSHLFNVGVSGTATPELFRRYEQQLIDRLEPVTAPAGSAVVYDSRLLHASGPNRTSATRLAAVCAVAPGDAELIHVVATDRRRRRVHLVDRDFFVDVHPHDIATSMPARYEVLDEYLDDASLAPGDVGVMWSDAAVPVPQPFVPLDLRGRVGRDLLVGATVNEPSVIEVGRAPMAPPDEPGSATLSLGAGERVDLAGMIEGTARDIAGLAGGPILLTALECPAVGAGAGNPEGAVSFDISTSVLLPTTEGVVLWNDGPGRLELAIVAPTVSAALRPPRRRLRRFVGAFGRIGR